MKRQLLSLLALGLTSVVLQLPMASPAEAAWSQCPADRFCVWKGGGGSGAFAYFAVGSADLRNPIGGVVFDNSITSVWNRTGRAWCMYTGYNYTPLPGATVFSGTKDDFTGFPWNNTFSSLRARPTGESC